MFLNNSKSVRLASVAGMVCLTALSCQKAQANSIEFASNPGGAAIVFNGKSQFSFANSTSTQTSHGDPAQYLGSSFSVDGVTAGMAGDSIGDLGTMSGTYTIGAITTVGSTQTAAVTGTGTLSIYDNGITGPALKGTIDWENVTTSGTGNTLNLTGVLNVTDVVYNGTESDLAFFAGIGSLAETLTFSFTPGKTLTQLADYATKDTYSGALSDDLPQGVPDGASTVGLLGGALLAIGSVRRKMAC
jgi:hypothetical protein